MLRTYPYLYLEVSHQKSFLERSKDGQPRSDFGKGTSGTSGSGHLAAGALVSRRMMIMAGCVYREVVISLKKKQH